MKIYHFIAILILCLTNFFIIKRSKSFLTPYTLISLSFFFPLLFSDMRLSGLQSASWHKDSLVVIGMAVISWLILPFVVVITKSNFEYKKLRINININRLTKHFNFLCLLISILYGSLFIVENYLLTGSAIPIFSGGETAHLAHTQTLPLINVITRGLPMVMIFMFFWYVKANKSPSVLIIAIVLFVLPLTRGSRLDLVIALLSVLVLVSETIDSKKMRGMLYKLIFIMTILITALSFVGFKRAEFTATDYSYANNIQFEINDKTEILSALYGNFSLPFENFDRLVRKNIGNTSSGRFGLMPLTNTFYDFSEVTSMYSMDDIQLYDDPVSVSGVSSALAYFYLDFGAVWSIIPMLVVMSIWLYLYRNIHKNTAYFAIYALYSGYFALAAFQPLMLNGATYRRMIFMLLLFVFYEVLKTILPTGEKQRLIRKMY